MKVTPEAMSRWCITAKLSSTDEDQFFKDVSKLVQSQRLYNTKHQISGYLFYSADYKEILLVQEGQDKDLTADIDALATFDGISDITVIEKASIDSRNCPGYGLLLGQPSDFGVVKGTIESLKNLWNDNDSDDEQETYMLLGYSSRLVLAPGEDMAQVIEEILEVSKQNNAKRQVGGSLCFNSADLSFYQFLEGEKNTVLKLYDKIAKDPRHTDISVGIKAKINSRLYPSWGMVMVDEQDSEGLKNFLQGEIRRRLPKEGTGNSKCHCNIS